MPINFNTTKTCDFEDLLIDSAGESCEKCLSEVSIMLPLYIFSISGSNKLGIRRQRINILI